jgi:hypothetical protein
MLRKAGLATLLVTSALAMSGCWGRVAGPTGGHQVLVIKPSVSDRIILDATIRADGGGYHRGAWALETVRALCYNIPLSKTNPISRAYCLSITWEDHRNDIEGAIRQVLTPDYDCLAASMGNPNPNEPPWDWFALPRGAYGCAD